MLNKRFKFKSWEPHYTNERLDIKNNTVRKIDLNDGRYRELITWNELGYNDGDIEIEIVSHERPEAYFVRNIRDIAVFNDLMVITWHPKKTLK